MGDKPELKAGKDRKIKSCEDCRDNDPSNFLEESFSVKSFSIDTEEMARKYVPFPDSLCFQCPLYEYNVACKNLNGFISFISYIVALQVGGVVFDFADFDIDVWYALGLYKLYKFSNRLF